MTDVTLRTYDDPSLWLEDARPFLMRHRAEYGLQWRLARSQIRRERASSRTWGAVWFYGTGPVGIAYQTPPFPKLLVSILRDADADLICDRILPLAREATCLQGRELGLQAIAEKLEGRGHETHFGTGQWVYRLDRVISPTVDCGRLDQASTVDLPFLYEAALGFVADTNIVQSSEDIYSRLCTHVDERRAFVLRVDGQPVACAIAGDHSDDSKNIGFVYTPRALRGHGYASNLVAKLSALCLAKGANFCSLYTEATNPTSNKIYRRIGYRLVARHHELWLSPHRR